MEQKITLMIAGKRYQVVAKSPSDEQYMRMAAEQINIQLKSYDRIFKSVSDYDKLVFVALSHTTAFLRGKDEREKLERDVDSVSNQLNSYIEDIKTNR